MSHEPKLGQLIDPYQKRDAIHIAIAPVIATEQLSPGEHIGFVEGDNERVGSCADPIGIVDPYLKEQVEPGERFYMFLYPQTITSLRHNWSHPAFGDEVAQKSPHIQSSEKWVKNFLRQNDIGLDYDDLITAVQGDGSHMDDEGYGGVRIESDYVTVFGRDAYGDIPDEFWDHVENVTGKTMKARPTHFSCSC